MSRSRQVSVAAELAPEFDRLRAEVASWCEAVLPCLECGHPPGEHDAALARCWGPNWRGGHCDCLGMVRRAPAAADDSTDRAHRHQEHT